MSALSRICDEFDSGLIPRLPGFPERAARAQSAMRCALQQREFDNEMELARAWELCLPADLWGAQLALSQSAPALGPAFSLALRERIAWGAHERALEEGILLWGAQALALDAIEPERHPLHIFAMRGMPRLLHLCLGWSPPPTELWFKAWLAASLGSARSLQAGCLALALPKLPNRSAQLCERLASEALLGFHQACEREPWDRAPCADPELCQGFFDCLRVIRSQRFDPLIWLRHLGFPQRAHFGEPARAAGAPLAFQREWSLLEREALSGDSNGSTGAMGAKKTRL